MTTPVPADDPRVEDLAKDIAKSRQWWPWEEISPGTKNSARWAARAQLGEIDAAEEHFG